MPDIEGIDRVTYGVEDLAACRRFFLDWGLKLVCEHAAGPVYERAEPVEVGHVVFFTDALDETTEFYQALGFHLSDRYPGRGHFLRCSARGGHHDLFLLQTPEAKRGLNHVAFTVRDLHEVI